MIFVYFKAILLVEFGLFVVSESWVLGSFGAMKQNKKIYIKCTTHYCFRKTKPSAAFFISNILGFNRINNATMVGVDLFCAELVRVEHIKRIPDAFKELMCACMYKTYVEVESDIEFFIKLTSSDMILCMQISQCIAK